MFSAHKNEGRFWGIPTKPCLKWIILATIIIVAALMVLDISFFLNGSLEFYPTEEQEEKIKWVTSFTFFVLSVVEACLVFLYVKEKK